jgi:nitroreductase
MKVSEAILTKRAIRAFKSDPLTEAEMDSILQAGRRAQSSKNSQPWEFLAVKDRKALVEMATLGKFGSPLKGATFAVGILTPDPDQRWSIMFDAGQAAAYMQLAAWESGIGSVPIAIYEPEKVRELFGIPEELYLNAAIAFGYPSDKSLLKRKPRGKGGRKAFEDLVHWDRYQTE